MAISTEVRRAFAENARDIGVENPFLQAFPAINRVQGQLNKLKLSEGEFPFIENPLLPSTSPVSGPNTLNLPNIDQKTISQTSRNNLTDRSLFDKLFPFG